MRRSLVSLVALTLVVAGLLAGTTTRSRAQESTPSVAGDAEANKEVVRKLYDAYNAGTWDAIGDVVDADVVDHDAIPGQPAGVEGVRQQLMGFKAAFSGEVVVDALVAEGDLVGDRIHLDGTQTGPFFGLPATGKPVQIEANELWRVRDGKIVEGWHVENLLQVLVQLGAVPSPAGPAGTPEAPMAESSPTAATAAAAASDPAAAKALVARFYAAVNAGDLAAFDEILAPDAIDHDPATPDQGPGREGIRQEIAALRAAFPDYHVTNQQVIAEGDLVVVHSTAGGTQNGPLAGIPPTGKPATFEAIDVWRVSNGQIVEVWHVEQLLQVLIEIGAIPAPGGEAAPSPAASPMA